VKYRSLIISRQYGSGGARIAALISEKLGWRLLDGQIIDAVAKAMRTDCSAIRTLDERAASWFHRLNRDALKCIAMMGGTPCSDDDFLDADTVATFTKSVIEQAADAGECVIVGRGAQCILSDRADVFRAFVYAPVEQRLHSVRTRTGAHISEKRLCEVDAERVKYISTYFGRHRQDFELYDLLISSKHGEEAAAATILSALSSASSSDADRSSSVETIGKT
jgi:cytidylate kinase